MTIIRFIGDVHGEFDEYTRIVAGSPQGHSIQLGDFGLGFVDPPKMWPNDRFIRGNHDNPELAKNHPNWIPDGSFDEQHSMYFIGGGLSIDQSRRVEGKTWWRDEELSFDELYTIFDRVLELKPRIIVSHCCPNNVQLTLFPNNAKKYYPSRTAQLFQSIFDVYQPEMWIFGHFHENKNEMFGNTRFICRGELKYIDLDISTS